MKVRGIHPHPTHVIPAEEWRCRWCGVSATSMYSESACPHPLGAGLEEARKPKVRIQAADDVEYIQKRMREIRQEEGPAAKTAPKPLSGEEPEQLYFFWLPDGTRLEIKN